MSVAALAPFGLVPIYLGISRRAVDGMFRFVLLGGVLSGILLCAALSLLLLLTRYVDDERMAYAAIAIALMPLIVVPTMMIIIAGTSAISRRLLRSDTNDENGGI
jgi:hypothetical protein